MKCAANPSVARRQVKKEVSERITLVNRLQLACSALILADKHGFARERLIDFIKETDYLYNSVNQGLVTFEDIANTLEKEQGINVGVKFKGKRVEIHELLDD